MNRKVFDYPKVLCSPEVLLAGVYTSSQVALKSPTITGTAVSLRLLEINLIIIFVLVVCFKDTMYL